MKKLFIILISIFFISIGCKEKDPLSDTRAFYKKKAEKTKKLEKSNTKEKSDRLVYNVSGTIYDKHEGQSGGYYFLITLDSGESFKWKTTLAKYKLKDKGSRVHFDYLAKERISDKAIE